MSVEDATAKPTESEKVRIWREFVLLEAGFSPQLATLIAKRTDIDLRRAEKLAVDARAKGLDIEVVADILL
jgi:hypothetical protein